MLVRQLVRGGAALVALAALAAGCQTSTTSPVTTTTGAPTMTQPAEETATAQPGTPAAPKESEARLPISAEDAQRYLHGGRVVVLPANSVDALQDAVAQAGSGGVVLVRKGTHTEHTTVTISSPVAIIGMPGAKLLFDSHADYSDFTMTPGLWIFNTSDVTVTGLEMRPVTAPGNCAILVQESPDVTIRRDNFYDFQNSVLVHHGDECTIGSCTVVATPAWQTGEILEADCVIYMNGSNPVVENNDFSLGLFGIFASGTGGILTGNSFHDCLYGMILCRVPANAFLLPDGSVVGSEVSGNHWTVSNNNATNNLLSGYIVIDGANANTLTANNASGNGAYGMELVGSSMRFGFCTPTCFANVVDETAYPSVTIKDCGDGDTITGGTLIDTTIDPCDEPCSASGNGAVTAGGHRGCGAAAHQQLVGPALVARGRARK